MTKEELTALAAARFEEIKELHKHDTLFDYEKEFERIWIELGRDVYQKSLGEVPEERRKKRLQTRFGPIELAHSHRYCHRGSGFRHSPYMQAVMTYVGHLDVYQRSAEIISTLLRIDASAASIYRVCDHYGKRLDEVLYQPREPVIIDNEETGAQATVVYAEVDGSMVFTDNRWREVKLARIFSSDQIADGIGSERGQSITHSEYVAHLGDSEEFLSKFRSLADSYAHLGERLIFLSDGAIWIKQAISEHYPEATQILDFYHAVEYLGEYAQSAISDESKRQRWIAQQKALLLAGRGDRVIATVRRQARTARRNVKEQAQRLVKYYRANRDRMRYDEYIKRGLDIGSGAIESAHRTVVQRRMKLAGQRWSNTGAENMLNLRVCSLSGNWNLVEHLIAQPTS